MLTRCSVICLLALALLGGAAPAQVRVLKQQADRVELGTERFSLTVEATGTLRAVKVGDTVLLPFAGLYTNPVSTTDGKAVRCCQAEQPGLGQRPPSMEVAPADGAVTVTVSRDCSHPAIYDNAPVWHLVQTVRVQPEGLVEVRYHCRFLRYLPQMTCLVVFAGAMPEYRDRAWRAQLPGRELSGTVPGALPGRGDLGGAWDLTVESSRGPVRYRFGGAGRVEMGDWGQYLEVGATLPDLPHGGEMYRGVEQEISVSVQLPVKP